MKRVCSYLLTLAASLSIVTSMFYVSALPAAGANLQTPAAAMELCFPFTPNKSGIRETTLYLTNGSDVTVTGVADILRTDGSSAALLTFQIDGGTTQTIDLASNPFVEQGVFHIHISVNGALSGAAHVQDMTTGVIGVYAGAACSQGTRSFYYFFAGNSSPTVTSELALMNSSAQTTTLEISFLWGGSPAPLFAVDIPAGGGFILSKDTLPEGVTLPGEVYLVRIASITAGFSGVLANKIGDFVRFAGALETYQVSASLPILYADFDLGGTTYDTVLSLIPFGSTNPNLYNMTFFAADGSPSHSPIVGTLQPGQVASFGALTWQGMPSGVHSAHVAGQTPLALLPEVVPASASTAPYGVDGILLPAANGQTLAGMVNNNSVFTMFSAQNLGGTATDITMNIYDTRGNTVATVQQQVNPGAALTVDSRSLAGLPSNFTGAAFVTSTNPLAAQIDTFSQRLAYTPLTSVLISGPGIIPVPLNQKIQILAEVRPMTATTPITYTWQVEDLPDIVHVSNDYQDVAPLSWQTPGPKTVKVTAANQLGEVMAETEVFVAGPPASVALSGPILGLVNQAIQFTAAVSPTYSATPITYTWQATDLPGIVNVTPFATDQVSFTWQTAGTKVVTVTADNTLGAVSTQFTITVPAAAVSTTAEPFTVTLGSVGEAGVVLSVPAGGTDAGYILTATPISVQQLISMTAPAPEDRTLLGAAVLLEAFASDGQPVENFVFAQPARLILRYTDAEASGDEASLRILTFSNNQWLDAADTCDPPSTYVRRPAQNEVEVAICHLSPYVLAKEAGNSLYLPAVSK